MTLAAVILGLAFSVAVFAATGWGHTAQGYAPAFAVVTAAALAQRHWGAAACSLPFLLPMLVMLWAGPAAPDAIRVELAIVVGIGSAFFALGALQAKLQGQRFQSIRFAVLLISGEFLMIAFLLGLVAWKASYATLGLEPLVAIKTHVGNTAAIVGMLAAVSAGLWRDLVGVGRWLGRRAARVGCVGVRRDGGG